jgi:hypothetical protein
MPKVAARIWLEVTNVRVERVQDISIRDIISEGSGEEDCRECFEQYGTPCCRDVDSECGLYEESFQDFTNLWDGINLKRGYVWDTNPWVWVIEFQQVAQ